MAKGIQNFIKPAEPAKRNKSNKSNKPKPKPMTTKPKERSIKVEEPRIVIDPSDFSISSIVDSNGIHVITKYLDQSINVCTLPRALFDSWLRSSPQLRTGYVSSQTNVNDARIKQMIIKETINSINRIFARAR
jgi:hypothetical protein